MLKKATNITLSILGLLFLTATVFAQNPPAGGEQEIAQKYGITFPINELGNCTSISKCKTFCENPNNHQICIDFAAKHNLSGGSSTNTTAKSDEEILKQARVELGCSSQDECMQYCEKEENMDKCMDFAARYNLMKDASAMKQKMATVKSLLGCSSMKSCMDFCNNPTNMQKCMEAYKQAGFDTGAESYSNEPPEVWCPKISSECKWDGSSCICSGPESCQKEPGCSWTGNSCNCGGGSFSQQESGEIWCPKNPGCKWTGSICECIGQSYSNNEGPPLGTDPTEWCKQNPDKCSYQQQGDPQAECAKHGCTFDGKTCQCPTQDQKQDQNVDFSSQCLSQPGCSWDAAAKICSCQVQTNPTSPADNPSVNQGGETIYKSECLGAGCRWTDNPRACDCSGVGKDVKGVSTAEGLLQKLINFLLGR